MNSMATGFEVQNRLLHGPTGIRLVNARQREGERKAGGSNRELVTFISVYCLLALQLNLGWQV